jgi:hypothetical protein
MDVNRIISLGSNAKPDKALDVICEVEEDLRQLLSKVND